MRYEHPPIKNFESSRNPLLEGADENIPEEIIIKNIEIIQTAEERSIQEVNDAKDVLRQKYIKYIYMN